LICLITDIIPIGFENVLYTGHLSPFRKQVLPLLSGEDTEKLNLFFENPDIGPSCSKSTFTYWLKNERRRKCVGEDIEAPIICV
jgi:hypothetical protein